MKQNPFVELYKKNNPFALIDVRERKEYVEGHWFGSVNIPLSELWRQLSNMIPWKGFPIYVLAFDDIKFDQIFKNQGYTNVHILQCSEPKREVTGFVRGEYSWSKAFGEILCHCSDFRELGPEQLAHDHRQFNLYDVRPFAEYCEFTLPGSQNLPNSNILGSLKFLQRSKKPAVLHCAGRTRSILGACTLIAAGYAADFYVFRGGTQAWQLSGRERIYGASNIVSNEQQGQSEIISLIERWEIEISCVHNKNDLTERINSNPALYFDVSNDDVQRDLSSIIKIVSGTNLVQQTDTSIACYHTPVVLIDNGTCSRAAFAAFWLKMMGYDASIINRLDLDEPEEKNQKKARKKIASVPLEFATPIYDFRRSNDFERGTHKNAIWANVSSIISNAAVNKRISVIVYNEAHLKFVELILSEMQTRISDAFYWDCEDACEHFIAPEKITDPCDRSSLFADRHKGNLEHSKAYLAWEEELPDQIDTLVKDLWQTNIQKIF